MFHLFLTQNIRKSEVRYREMEKRWRKSPYVLSFLPSSSYRSWLTTNVFIYKAVTANEARKYLAASTFVAVI
jgi:hypothetical protein